MGVVVEGHERDAAAADDELGDAAVDGHAVERDDTVGAQPEQPGAHRRHHATRGEDDGVPAAVEATSASSAAAAPPAKSSQPPSRVADPRPQRRVEQHLHRPRRPVRRPVRRVALQEAEVVVLVPAPVDRQRRVRQGQQRGVLLAPQPAGDRRGGAQAAAGELCADHLALAAADVGQHVVVVGAERRLAVAHEQHDRHRTSSTRLDRSLP